MTMVIFLYGPDTFRSRQKLRDLKNKFITQRDSGGFSVVVLDGANLTVDEFRKAVLSPGLFAAKRLIIIENLLATNKDKNLYQEILHFLKRIKRDEDNIVIFWEAALSKVFDQKIFDCLKKEKFSQEFSLLKENQIVDWIKKEVVKRGGRIDSSVAKYLVDELGTDLWRLNTEIDKLVAYAGQQLLTKKQIETLIHPPAEDNIWLLVDAIGEKNKQRALKLLSDQLRIGASIDSLFGMFIRQYRIILQVKEELERNKKINQYQLANQLKIPFFVCRKAIEQAKNYSLEEIKKIYRKLLSIDIKMKTSRINPEVLLDLLIIKCE